MRDVKIPNWLQGLPFAPEFRPTDTEFADPIAYISKIEKEAGAFGICKVIPPLPKPSKKYVLANLNKSLLKCPELGDDVSSLSNGVKVSKGEPRAVFTTRQQELGLSGKKGKSGSGGQPQLPLAHKQVWQSGEIYTLDQFDSKAKTFAKSQLSTVKDVSPLVIETLFWKASREKPIYTEYANDVPGSGFGEPEEPFRCVSRCRRRRKRGTFTRNSRECSDFNKDQVYKMSNSDETKGEPDKPIPDSSEEISKASTSSSNTISDQMALVPRQKVADAGNEMEGTSGWKLSNSPWNLQVIARSPGSLTRFMPDDIPGVTSPMIYIGMLFSWFAWHVEDHELHSLNFLHTGSQKTWYSIPGDYAFTFEEVIRKHAYGGNIDRLAALTLLGEKTTLLSPEVVVASGIPCCRLVQNPGEFVVTFPRAYHIGFSHGFNCGEAANFGTPKWLTIAKEAAVRRAAMNHLPMLSHQQLLYLLTMSFISRVPRSLLPGVRSSRLKDRQKEERELLVKKAFVEDILNENKLLTTLLRKKSSCNHAVLWDLESLASLEKESNLFGSINADISPTPAKDVHSQNDIKKDLCSEMNLYAESMDDPYVGDDDMSSDFQVDSGTLPCVACGVLGFPFMSVVQPNETAAFDIVTTDHVFQDPRIQSPTECHSPSDINTIADGRGSVSEGLGVRYKNRKDKCSDRVDGTSSNTESMQTTFSCGEGQSLVSGIHPPMKDSPHSTKDKFIKGWNTSSKYLRPRIFCLEHARQTEELLHSKGGAKVLVICHSDFLKVKAHAAAIAEQIGSPFRYTEIPLHNASQDDLNLINLAIDDEEKGECGEDWTSKLNINLQQCVKLGNKSLSEKKVQHALTLDGLFPDTAPHARSSILDWRARKARSRRNVNNVYRNKPSKSITVNKDEALEAKSDTQAAGKGGCLIQYSRRRLLKSKLGGSVTDLGKWGTQENSSSELGVLEKSDVQQCLPTPTDVSRNSFPSEDAGFVFSHPPMVENVDKQTSEEHMSRKISKSVEVCDSTKDGYEMENQLDLAGTSSEQSDGHSENSAGSLPVADGSIECCEIGISKSNEAGNDMGMQHDFHANGGTLMEMGGEPEKSAKSCVDEADVDCANEIEHETENSDGSTGSEPVPSNVTSVNESTAEERHSSGEDSSLQSKRRLDQTSSEAHPRSTSKSRSRKGSKRKREVELQMEEQFGIDGFIRSPCEGLRPRGRKDASLSGTDRRRIFEEKPAKKVKKPATDDSLVNKDKKHHRKRSSSDNRDTEGCKTGFQTKAELALKHNRCPYRGCGKKFLSQKYAMLHLRVHEDERPLKCSWKGCKMSFKWAWARTEHLRVHTGERPYKCKVDGCGLTFRFVSDYSRHRRKTGHYVDGSTT